MTRLAVGDRAPDFCVETVDGQVCLADLLADCEAGVVIYFYPRAMTPGCTKEACDFRDSQEWMESQGYRVIGISPDGLESLEKFAAKENLGFVLGSDPEHRMMEDYGAWGEKKNYGRTVVGVIRSTVVVDKTGVITHAFYNVRATGHVGRVRRELGED